MAKRNLFSILCCITFFISAHCQHADHRNGTAIKGEGDIVKETISLEALRGVNLGFSGEIFLTQGNTQSIEMEGQKNILDNIKRTVKNGVWHVYFDRDVRDHKPVTIRITLPTLEEASVSGSGSIRTTNKFSGAGIMKVNVAGSGDVEIVYDAGKTELNLSGSGEITLTGTSKDLAIAISGSGDVDAANLQTENCSVSISGSGDASVNASNQLNTNIAGSGDVRYAGNASVNAKVSGSGEVIKVSQ